MKSVFRKTCLLFVLFLTPLIAIGSDLSSRKAAEVIPVLSKVTGKDKYSEIEKILGKPDFDIGSGLYVFIFRLDDGTTISVGTPDRKEIFYIQRSGKGLKEVQMIFKKKEV